MSRSYSRLRLTVLGFALVVISILSLAGSPPTGTAPQVGGSDTAQVLAAAAPEAVPQAVKQRVQAAYFSLPLSFEANRGQTDPEVKFLSRGSGYSLFLSPTEAVLALSKPADQETEKLPVDKRQSASGHRQYSVLRMKLIGANPDPALTGIDALPGKSNYFTGSDPEKWLTNVPNYLRVKYTEVYPGIDLIYYGNQRQLEYDFVVSPGADPADIAFEFQGAERLEIAENGDLIVQVHGGKVIQRAPKVYQERDGVKKSIAGRYVLTQYARVGFQVAAYDASRPLVIDPVLAFSTFLGGGMDDSGRGIAVDSSGNAYVTGWTNSWNFPTANALQAALGGSYDAFVAKLDATGSALVYSTYLGGISNDYGYGIAVDSSGNAYVTGRTNSAENFPTANALQAAFGGLWDAFVAKISDTAPNSPPTADDKAVSTDEDAAVAFNLTGSDPDGDPLSYSVVSSPTHGALSGTAPNLTYTPSANYNGADSFTYKANDGTADSNVATVSITVNPVNDAPLAANDSYNIDEDTTLNVAAPGVLGNDTDIDSASLTAVLVSLPSHGTLALNPNGSFSYTPAINYNGPDSFTYKANDGLLDSNVATVNITVNAVNDAPAACVPPPADLVSWWPADGDPTDIAGGRDGTLVGGAGFAPGQVAEAFSFSGGGYVSVPDDPVWTLGTNAFTIDLWVRFNSLSGRDPFIAHDEGGFSLKKWIFWYDAFGHRGPSLGPLDPVVYSWNPVVGRWYHVAVTRSGSTYTLYIDGVAVISEADARSIPDPNAPLTIGRAEALFLNGLVDEVEIHNRALTAAEIQAIFAAGSAGKCKVATGPPTATDQAVATDEDTPVAVSLAGSDPDGDPLTFSVVSGPAHGALSGTAPNLTYTPAANFNGADSFTFKANDGTVDSDVATVTITVNPVNDPPVAVDDTATTTAGTPVTINVLANDSDVDGNALAVTGVTQGTSGSVVSLTSSFF